MKYLKNTQIADEYGVFRGSVGKWITAARNKENNLQVEMINDKWYILDNTHNRAELLNLKERGLKYRKKSAFEKIAVNPEIYKVFDETTLIELITKLEEDKIIPLKFSYLGKGADYWNELVEEMYLNKESYYVSQADELFNMSLGYLLNFINNFDTVNIVDVGPGNGITIKSLLEMLEKNNKSINYSAIDISQRMIDIIETNLKQWYPNMNFDSEIGDMDYVVIRERLFNNKISNPNSCNLILFLGSTIGNVYDRHRVFQNFADSLGKNDFFIINNGLDVISARTKFATLENKFMQAQINWIPEMLGLSKDLYQRINKYDERSRSRVQVLKLNKNIDLEFKLTSGAKLIQFEDGDEITIWNHHSHTPDEFIGEVRDAGLNITYLAKTPQKTIALLICEKE